MKSFLKFLSAALIVLLLSAFLAPILFRFLPYKFERIFNRLVMILTLAAVAFLVRIKRETLAKLGLLWNRDSPRELFLSFSIGVATLAVLLGAHFLFRHAIWKVAQHSAAGWMIELSSVVAAAVLVSVIEEFFFRGVIFHALKERLSSPVWASVLLTSLFYALIHFIGGKAPFIGPHPTFWDSLRLASAPLSSLANWRVYWPEAVGLFLFGLLLNALLIWTRSLYPSIGLHAAGVFFVKIDGLFVDVRNNRRLLYGTHDLIDGALGWIFLLILAFILGRIFKMKKQKNNFGKAASFSVFFFIAILFSNIFPALGETGGDTAAASFYRFSRYLQDAQAILKAEDSEEKGVWQDGRFTFRDARAAPVIEIALQAGTPSEAILFDSSAKGIRRLRFSGVPPGSQLIVYHFAEAPNQKNAAGYVDFQILVGRHPVGSFRLSNDKGWKKEVIDLGMVSFLNRNVDVTFEIMSSAAGGHFRFNAEMVS